MNFVRAFLLGSLVLGARTARADAFGAAVESPAQTFLTGGDIAWTIESQAPGTGWADTWIAAPAVSMQGESWITTDVTGPVSIYFEATGLDFGWEQGITYTLRAHSCHYLYLPAGNHTLRWEARLQTTGRLSRLYLEPGVTFSEALGLPGGEWEGTGTGFVPFLHHPTPPRGRTGKGLVHSWDDWSQWPDLTGTFRGRGTIVVSADGFFDTFYGEGGIHVFANGHAAVNYHGKLAEIFFASDGPWQLRFTLMSHPYPFACDFWIHSAALVPANPPGFGDLWMASSHSIGAIGGSWQAISNGGPGRNTLAMRGTNYGYGGVTLQGPGRVSFWMKYTPPSGPAPWLEATCDFSVRMPFGERQFSWSDPTGWRYFEIQLPNGDTRLQWRHETSGALYGLLEITAPVPVSHSCAPTVDLLELKMESEGGPADDDGDHVPNLLEWIAGTDPLCSGPSGLQVEHWNGDLIFGVPRQPAESAGVVFTVEESANLTHWEVAVPAPEQVVSATHRHFHVQVASVGTRYFRLRATLP